MAHPEAYESVSFCNLDLNDRIVINISGERYETLESTLMRYPNTLLGSPIKRSQYFDQRQCEYFFNRNRQAFDAILFYYQSCGRLIKPELLPENIFVEEVRFFEIPSDLITAREELEEKLMGKNAVLPKNDHQKKIWLAFSVPESSFLARVIALWSVMVILISVIIPCVESSLLEFNETSIGNSNVLATNVYVIIEMACYIWFTIELIFRLASAPEKIKFCKQPLNVVDILTVLPYYIVLAVEKSRTGSLSVMRAARMLRVLRIFKLSRYSSGMRVLLYTFLMSLNELWMFMLFAGMSVLLSSAAAYYAETAHGRQTFESIPGAFWWSISTVTTVGYGDQYPLTASGKIVGSILSVFGVLVVALPVFLFVSNFKKVLSTKCTVVEDDSRRDQESIRRHKLGIKNFNTGKTRGR
ncbi:potassium voltage-gated channel subfamily A member 1 [Nematostella vectensis]